jgi:hypothetical protein
MPCSDRMRAAALVLVVAFKRKIPSARPDAVLVQQHEKCQPNAEHKEGHKEMAVGNGGFCL